jgi:hypothetical protein
MGSIVSRLRDPLEMMLLLSVVVVLNEVNAFHDALL